MSTRTKLGGKGLPSAPAAPSFWDEITREVAEVRSHLGMDVAFVSEFGEADRVLRVVDAKGSAPIAAGDRIPRDAGYCLKVVEQRLPQLIPDTHLCPAALEVPETLTMPIRAHLGLPIRRFDGRVFGTFCCFSFNPDPTLNKRDLEKMRPLTERIATQVESFIAKESRLAESAARIRRVLDSHGPAIVYQPIYALSPRSLNGAEALARFEGDCDRSPDFWFAEADEVGLRIELEMQAIHNALREFASIWARSALYLGLNASPQTLLYGSVGEAIAECPADRVVLEITEHAPIEDYDALLRALKPLRERGVKLAVDDAGSGFASFRHILQLQPDIIKIDSSLTRDIDLDKRRRALARALISFARETEGRIVAEGVETAAELKTLGKLGAHAAQGYHLGRPVPASQFARILEA